LDLIIDGVLKEKDIPAEKTADVTELYLQSIFEEDKTLAAFKIDGEIGKGEIIPFIKEKAKVKPDFTLELITIPQAKMVEELTTSLKNYLFFFAPFLDSLSLDLNRGKNISSENLLTLTEGLSWISEALDTLSLNQKHLPAPFLELLPITLNRLKDILSSMVEALEKDDRVELADLLTYELKEELNQLQKALGQSFFLQ